MTYEEWFDIARHIKSVYPKNMEFLESIGKVKEWYEYMREYDYKQMKKASDRHIEESKYPPTIHDLRIYYNAISDENSEKRTRLNDIYMAMVKYYPVSLRDDERAKVFRDAINADTYEETVKKAKELSKRVKQKVQSAELSGNDNLPILSVCIKECAYGTENRR